MLEWKKKFIYKVIKIHEIRILDGALYEIYRNKNAGDILMIPKYITWYPNGTKEIEEYITDYRYGSVTTIIQGWYKNGNIRRKTHFLDCMYHNTKGPAHEMWHSNGVKDTEEYKVYGKYESPILENGEYGPQYISYYKNGNKECENYCINGKESRNNGLPSSMGWYENGNKSYEIYKIDGMYYREPSPNGEDLPAYISWYKNGNKQYEEYYEYNKTKTQVYGSKSWYKNGNKKSEKRRFANDEYNIYKEWDENGNIICDKKF